MTSTQFLKYCYAIECFDQYDRGYPTHLLDRGLCMNLTSQLHIMMMHRALRQLQEEQQLTTLESGKAITNIMNSAINTQVALHRIQKESKKDSNR